ncbi:neuronal acetylcholine receptor subunit eat-2-like [Lycorma delicatula]|uniref:neuronal acetylcholine receptor subunit eat-2-like n=1 Tax=Lycorma delicatula TaxID=130591 RepID=UPI003F50D542
MLDVLKFISFLLLIKLLIIGVNPIVTDRDPDCKIYLTYGYAYNKLFRFPESSFKGNELYMRFLVQARSDAHVILSVTDSLEDTLPVYEVVLGGGKNTFSAIRRSKRSLTKSSVMTADLLSSSELRGFWIHISKEGLIEVGKEGEDDPFVYWQDTDPLPIKYFGFSTWTDVFGKWFYDCKLHEENGKIIQINDSSTEVQKPMTWVDHLRNDLLKNYDPQVIPKMNFNEKLAVSIKLECHHIKLDSKMSQITVDGMLEMTWKDEKLKWDPNKYGEMKSLQLIHGEIWRPELVLYNSVGHGTDIFGISRVIVSSEGEVLWVPRTRLQAHCKLDLSSWPWDQHTCELKLGFWALKNFLKLEMAENGTELSNHKTASEWNLLSIDMKTTGLSIPWFNYNNNDDDDDDNDGIPTDGDLTSILLPTDTTMIIKITLKRVSNIYNYIFLVPLIVMASICILSFGFSPLAPAKIGIQCICLILGSMFLIILDKLLPATAEQVPFLFRAYSESLIMVTISTTISVCALAITRQPHFEPPHQRIIYILNSSPLKTMLFLPELNFDGLQKYDQLSDGEESSDENVSLHYWTLLAFTLDRITLFISIIFIIHIFLMY